MIIQLSSDALIDLEEGFVFYQRQSQGLGAYFISCLTSDIEALTYFGGVRQIVNGYHRALLKHSLLWLCLMLAGILYGYGSDWVDQ
ncbi:MAG: hypothetical protein WBN89_07065 [Prochlorococcaceae cyanobacterium]